MKRFKKYRAIGLFLICIFIFVGCSLINNKNHNIQNASKNEKSQIEKDMEYLTSDICAGRRPGTEGNEQAANYIVERFNEIGLDPLEKDYVLTYTKKTEKLGPNKITLEVLDGSNVVDTLTYGRDYIEVLLNDITLTLPLVNSPGDYECALLVDDPKESVQYRNNNYVKLIIQKNSKSSRGGSFYNDLLQNYIPSISVFPETYENIQKYIGKSIRLNADIDIEEDIQKNIVGVIKGENGSNALVISAHYDHVGNAGDKIWRGALDNASGVCAMLEAAKQVVEFYKDHKPQNDIIFCAFNSEETISTGESGSFYFNQQMEEIYESVFNINLDCLGNRDGKDLIICSNKSTASVKVAEDVLGSYKNSGISAMLGEEDVVSDHKNFIHAISLSSISNIESSNIHTLEDTPDKIDMEYLILIGGHLGEYIISDLDMENLFRSINKDVIETTDRSENRMITTIGQGTMSVDEFEEKFNCELNSMDSSLIYIFVPAHAYRKKGNDHGGSEEKIETENLTDEMTLSDIRIFTFCFDNIALNFYTYFKDIPFEMMAYEMELEMAGYDEKSLDSGITIDDRDYFVATESDLSEGEEGSHSKQMCTIFETDKMFLKVSALFPSPTTDHIKDAEEYKNYLLENVPEGCIDEMVKLLLE